jgi:hypothetical protein
MPSQNWNKEEDRKQLFALIAQQEAEQQRLAPGFLEWRQAEDKRLQSKSLSEQVKHKHALWQQVNFKAGPERDNYIEAMKALGEAVNSKQ